MKNTVNSSAKKKQRIGIDARFYGPLGKGLGRYVQEVVDNLIRINEEEGGEFEYHIFLSKGNYNEFHSSSPFVSKQLVNLAWYSWREQLFFPKIIKKAKIDLMHYPHFNVPVFSRTNFVVTIHDLILTRFPSRRASMLPATLYWLKQYAYRLVIKTALKKARKIITVSNFTKKDIIDQFKVDPGRIVVTYEGIAKLGSETAALDTDEPLNFLKKYGIKQPYILYVGNAYPHKNLEALLPAFQSLSQIYPDLSLVMVGKEDYFYQRLKSQANEINSKLNRKEDLFIFPGFVPDRELSLFYKNALFYIFPSLYEGFGLPPLEAMSFSCPVLSSNQASLPEIISNAALYFDPYNQEDMLNKIKRLISDEALRLELISLGHERIKIFSWQDCAQGTREVYQSTLV